MDWRILEVANFIVSESSSFYVDDIKYGSLNDKNLRDRLSLINVNKKHSFIVSGIKVTYFGWFSFSSLLGFNDKKHSRFSILYSSKDARFIVPNNCPLQNILRMTTNRLVLSRIRGWLITLVQSLGLRWILPHIIVLNSDAENSLISSICSKLNSPNLQFCLFTGTKGINRRMTLQITEEKKEYYVKIPTNVQSQLNVQKEANALLLLRKSKISKFSFPGVLHFDNHKKWLIQSPIDLSNLRSPKEFTTDVYSVMEEVFNLEVKILNLQDQRTFSFVYSNLKKYGDFPEILSLLELVREKMGVRVGCSHGDFTPWNIKMNSDLIHVYDWEAFSKEQLPFFDYFHYHIQSGILVEKESVDQIYKHISKLKKKNSFGVVEIDNDDVDIFLIVYLLNEHYRYKQLLAMDDPGFKQLLWQDEKRKQLIDYHISKLNNESSSLHLRTS